MSDDFFAEIETKIAHQRAAATERQNKIASVEAWGLPLIPSMIEVAQAMRHGLQARGITAQIIVSGPAITFALQYANGDLHQSTTVLDVQQGGFVDHGYFVENNVVTTTIGRAVGKGKWKANAYQKSLERHVKAYVDQAARHGGVR